jgi:GNAT superfamily N-acetyltransferase
MLVFRTEPRPEDLAAVKEIIESSGFFYDIEVPVALELVEDRLTTGDQSDYQFIFADVDDRTVSYACYGHIDGTIGTYDLYWIATHESMRGRGIGKRVLEATHKAIQEQGGQRVIAETSSLAKYAPTRQFYLNAGYVNEAFIADFYREGDGKVFFVKRLDL